jgi:ectoine hydroxylase-related dioxygenase (phytanoyl-CoA dioxygenase family)
MPKIELPEPEQIIAQAGDIVLCHYQIAHCAGPNVSPHVRYGIFYRLSRIGHGDRKLDVMKDLWLEWDGIRPLLNE